MFLYFFTSLALSFYTLSPLILQAQLPTNCPNSNFNTGTFDEWIGCYGTFGDPCSSQGFDTASPNPLHSLIPGPGFQDPNACDMLTTVFPGEAFSARLGHDVGGSHAAQLKYEIAVSPQNYLFIYRYAIVLQDPNHNPGQQPSFTIEVQDVGGAVLDSTCGYYYVYAQPNLPEWKTCQLPGTDTEWKDWTTVGMELTPYVNKTVRIVFTIRDCSLGGHYGYAYISTYCDYLQMQIALCEGDSSATLTAPPGFFYDWWTVNGDTTINGDTTQSIVIPNPATGQEYFCKLTAFNGCEVTISQILNYTIIQANFTHTPGCIAVPVIFTDSSTINQNQIVNWKWNFGDGTPVITGIQNPAHTFTSSGTYTVQLIAYSTDNCSDTVSKQVVVSPRPVLSNDTLRKAICSGDYTDVILTSLVPNTLFTWTASASAPAISGYQNNSIPSAYLNDLLVNSGNQTDSVTYIIHPVNAFCPGLDTVFTVLVFPAPFLTNSPPATSICDNTFTAINLVSNLDTTLFTWMVTPGSGYITGYSDNTILPSAFLNQQLFLSGFLPDSLIYHITPHAYGCSGPVSDYEVTVNPFPEITNYPMFDSICDLHSPMLTLEATCNGSTFSWIAQVGFGDISGFSNGGGPVIDQILDNHLVIPGEVDYIVTPTAYGCTGSDTTFYILVNPTTRLTNDPPGDTVCSGETTGVALSSNVNPVLFTWICTASSPDLSGFSDNNIPTDSIVQTLFNAGYTIETVVYHITPVYEGCPGDTSDFTLTVNPIPDVVINPQLSGVCDSTVTQIELTGNVSGSLFTWTAGGSSLQISGYSSGSGNIIQQQLFNSGYIQGTVTYEINPVANGCLGTPVTASVDVNPVPVVSLAACFDTVTTTHAQPLTLKGGIPYGGSFTGTGVNGSRFYPALAGAGTHRITYSYTNQFGCRDSARLSIFNFQSSTFNCGDSLTDIRDNRKYLSVEIGSQCWLASNLNFGNPIISTQLQRDNCLFEKYCMNDDPSNCSFFGGLYQWDEVMQYSGNEEVQGFCPPGWHIPGETDWNDLFLFYISNGFAGSALKSSGYSGFNASVSGIRFHTSVWKYPMNDPVLRSILFWSSTPHGVNKTWAYGMNEVISDLEYTPSVSFYPALRSNAFAVRCIRD